MLPHGANAIQSLQRLQFNWQFSVPKDESDPMPVLRSTFAYLWASPNTLLGLLLGGVSMLFGTRIQFVEGVIEFHGGPITWILARMPIDGGAMAMTIGHVVWGRTPAALEITRVHERVHVRQYVTWGPLFLPAYAIASLAAWWRGESAYRGNCFEREAYDVSG